MGPRKHLNQHGTIHLGIGALKVPFSAKMPLVNPRLTKSQKRSKSSQNNIFRGFTSNSSYLETFVNFHQVWPEVDPWWAPKTLILIWPSKRGYTTAIVEIIKIPFRRLFMSRNRS